jgi:hypothetical protein
MAEGVRSAQHGNRLFERISCQCVAMAKRAGDSTRLIKALKSDIGSGAWLVGSITYIKAHPLRNPIGGRGCSSNIAVIKRVTRWPGPITAEEWSRKAKDAAQDAAVSVSIQRSLIHDKRSLISRWLI